jgi:hypothetical protein
MGSGALIRSRIKAVTGSKRATSPIRCEFTYFVGWSLGVKPQLSRITRATHVGIQVRWKGPEAAVSGHGPGGVKNRPVPTSAPAPVPLLHLPASAPAIQASYIARNADDRKILNYIS